MKWSVLDILALISCFASGAALLIFPFTLGQILSEMYAEFGGELPALTSLVISYWLLPSIALIGMAAVALAFYLRSRGEMTLARSAVWGTTVVLLLAMATAIIAAYLPIFSLAEAISRP